MASPHVPLGNGDSLPYQRTPTGCSHSSTRDFHRMSLASQTIMQSWPSFMFRIVDRAAVVLHGLRLVATATAAIRNIFSDIAARPVPGEVTGKTNSGERGK